MYDVVSDPQELNDEKRKNYPGLVLEWFDNTLQNIPSDRYRHNLILFHAIIHAVLSSSAMFYRERLVNTGVSSHFVAGINHLANAIRYQTGQRFNFSH